MKALALEHNRASLINRRIFMDGECRLASLWGHTAAYETSKNGTRLAVPYLPRLNAPHWLLLLLGLYPALGSGEDGRLQQAGSRLTQEITKQESVRADMPPGGKKQ